MGWPLGLVGKQEKQQVRTLKKTEPEIMSSSPADSSSVSSSIKAKKVVVPKVWKRPHSTIYGKNVEFGSSLYSDKLGEINGRKFNSDLPWSLRNSGSLSTSSGGHYSQGYLSQKSNLPLPNTESEIFVDFTGKTTGSDLNFVRLLDITNPNRLFSNSSRSIKASSGVPKNDASSKRIDFYDQYENFTKEIERVQSSSLMALDPLVRRRVFDDYLDFDYSIGVFVPKLDPDSSSTKHRVSQSLMSSEIQFNGSQANPMSPVSTLDGSYSAGRYRNTPFGPNSSIVGSRASDVDMSRANSSRTSAGTDINLNPLNSTISKPAKRLGITSSPYGQSADGRKLSLSSINPQSYRPSVPQKTSFAHASDGEELELHDRSSPFYTDR